MERLKKKREDRKGIEKKEWFGRTRHVSSDSFAMTFYGLIMRRSQRRTFGFEEAYERFHTGMLRGNIKYRNNKKEVEVPVCDTQ